MYVNCRSGKSEYQQFCSYVAPGWYIYFPNRAVFNWVLLVIHVLLWFCFISPCDWLKKWRKIEYSVCHKCGTRKKSSLTESPTFPRKAPTGVEPMTSRRHRSGALTTELVKDSRQAKQLSLLIRPRFLESRLALIGFPGTGSRSTTKTNPNLLARVFPSLGSVTWICLEFRLVDCVICVCIDMPE